jgi:hypothetical protein
VPDVVTRRIGNYGECEITMQRGEDGMIYTMTRVTCLYGNEWPMRLDGSYDLAPFAPTLREMLQELGAWSDDLLENIG